MPIIKIGNDKNPMSSNEKPPTTGILFGIVYVNLENISLPTSTKVCPNSDIHKKTFRILTPC